MCCSLTRVVSRDGGREVEEEMYDAVTGRWTRGALPKRVRASRGRPGEGVPLKLQVNFGTVGRWGFEPLACECEGSGGSLI
jgi:hypothetical protein